ncbi:MAG: hypothetical protein HC933_17555 [Pleurocapsa sp. SU_196_0]|nr:hypothetical protein [Pleurocapsa sp. SU_196_0]
MPFNAKEFLEQHGGGAEAALTKLFNDRHRAIQSKNRLLEALGVNMEETEDLTERTKALSGELKAYRNLGKPEELQRKLEVGTTALESLGKLESDPAKLLDLIKGLPSRLATAEGDAQTLRRTAAVRDVADAYGYKASVLEKLLKDDNLEVVFDANAEREVERQGKKEKVKGVATVTKDGKPVALEQHASSAWEDFMPSLTPNGTPTPGKPGSPAVPTGAGKGDAPKPVSVEERAQQKALEYGSSI